MAQKIIAILIVFAMFCACGEKEEATPRPIEPAVVEAPETPDAYPPSIRKPFLDGCTYGMSVWLGPEMASAVCSCSWAGIEKKYSLAEFVELSGKVSDDFIPKEVQVIVEECVKAESKEAAVEGDQEDPRPSVGSKYPESVRKSYLTNCVKSAQDDGTPEQKATAYCSCTLESFEAQYEISQFLGLLSKEEAEKSEKFMSVIQQCLPELTRDEPSTARAGETARFPERLSAPFIEACMSFFEAQLGKNTATRTCQCTLKKVEKHYSLEDFIKIIPKLDEGGFPEDLEAMFVFCVAEATKR